MPTCGYILIHIHPFFSFLFLSFVAVVVLVGSGDTGGGDDNTCLPVCILNIHASFTPFLSPIPYLDHG